MRLTKNKIIAATIILIVLVAAFFSSGMPRQQTTTSLPSLSEAIELTPPTVELKDTNSSDIAVTTSSTPALSQPSSTPTVENTPKSEKDQESPPVSAVTEKPMPIATQGATPLNKETPKPTAPDGTKPTPTKAMELDPKTGKDQYLTDPVPEGKPLPIEPQNTKISDKQMTVTLSVSCLTILNNMKLLDPEKVELVPKDGIIFKSQQVTFYEGESVFNVLQREMKKNKIHMEFVNTPIYNSAYIEGIHNLYEFDCGELSGWMYKVNGWFPNYGASRYQLKQGDVIEWVYTCDLGRDVGDTYNSTGGGKQ
ncbi:DUF4430 domain-containing protein [Paenibacillus sp. LMG 31461]|uniref:DUF4430 domain-containing protein n=1 Tax=Paenibacillus plantarum TaxID=2654975 RepID=A0ABX1XHX8_9BACL|nr:DUF4430 domain-containing protein [Paenibacillus plantarum]NOU67606.1 DUF4430 domain-containing protein [Paenibacillus plantarum]